MLRSVLVVLIALLPTLAGCLTEEEQPDVELIPAAMPNVGDKGIYTLLKAPLSEEARQQEFSEERFLNISFEFEGASVYHDRDGKAHAVWDLRVGVADETNAPRRPVEVERFHVDPETFRVLDVTSIGENSKEREWRDFLVLPMQKEAKSNYAYLSFGGGVDLPCGLLESWLGGYFPSPGRTVPATVECTWGKNRWNQEAHDIVVGVQAEGEPLLVVDHHITYVNESLNTPAPEWRAWYAEGIPYPVRMQDLTGGNFGAPGDKLVLKDFERGADPRPIIAPQALQDVPPLVEAPVTPWTVPDLGIEHPWPLHEAYNYALSDPNHNGLRDFLEQHPGAYLAYASHVASDVDDAHIERWSFAVVDRDEHHYVSIAREQRLAVTGLEQGPTRYRYEDESYGTKEWLQDSVFPAKERLPRHLPTPESILAQWAVVMSDGAHPVTSPSYSIFIHCGNDCETFAIDLGAGATYYHREGKEGYPAIRVYRDTWDSSELVVRHGKLSTSFVSKTVLDYAVDGPFTEIPSDSGV